MTQPALPSTATRGILAEQARESGGGGDAVRPLARATAQTASELATDSDSDTERLAVVTLVMRGRLASSDVEEMLCAPLVMFHSVRAWMSRPFDAVVLAGYLGPPCLNITAQPLRRCKPAQLRDPTFWAAHEAAVVRLRAALEPRGVLVSEGVTREVALARPALVQDVLFVKLRVLELRAMNGRPYGRVLFLDADVIAIGDVAETLLFRAEQQLVAYSTCTTPLNAGCFAVRTSGLSPDALAVMERAYLRARPTCDSPAFHAGGFDPRLPSLGSPPWPGAALCAGRAPALRNESWDFPTACIADQGLLFHYFEQVARSYAALRYTQVRVLHWNGAGPKPWAEPEPIEQAAGAARRPARQRCWEIWWAAHDRAAAAGSLRGLKCAAKLTAMRVAIGPELVRAAAAEANGTGAPCYKCEGGGHAACWPKCRAAFLSEKCVRVRAEDAVPALKTGIR